MTIAIRFGGYQGDKSVHTRGGRALGEALARASDGSVTLDFDENIVIRGHKAADLLHLTEDGALDGCYFSSSYLAKRVPELGLFDQHFVVPDRRRAYALLDGALGERLKKKVSETTGYTVLGYWDNGLRHISSRTPIRTPEDCADLKIRTLANEDHQRVFRSLGFDPKAIDVRDLPEAVETGAVDAQENPLTNIYNFGLHNTHRSITLSRHLLGVALVLFRTKSVENWPDPVREAVEEAVSEATLAQRRFAEEDDEICRSALEAEGVELIDLSETDRARFASRCRREVETTRRKFDEELIALFDKELGAA
ncbi:MAG: TRAP transporter substrate-binding protein [Roseibium sp.]|uniref:TRAP transporter substrate-binding protein n=1 Tax=Roseibium sp. TaxID=1936156 RepID=UPI00260748CD|nr:TRAP transporter substrate-binding protein [Roseibium sp.]MCV0429313.1 TRAP transporter substrate-binding protein [Roseibium sp.]